MGTEVSVTLWHEDAGQGRRAIDAVMEQMHRVDKQWNPEDADSELSQINIDAANGVATVSTELSLVLDKALYYSRLSGGAFDISFASVARYYNYREGIAPQPDLQSKALKAVDYRLIKLDVSRRRLHFENPDLQIDLGGIAKGYAVDRAVALLEQRGIEHASISAGGDSRLLGDRRGRPWMVGIRNPRAAEGEVALVLPLQDIAFSTSGDYERFYLDPESGERIHHIINPGTGKSAGELMSVSVLGPRGFDTDPLSTTLFVLGVERGMALVETLDDFDAIMIDADGQVHYSSGLTD